MQLGVNQFVVCQHIHTEPFLKTTLVGMPLAIVLPDVKKPSFPLQVLVQLQGRRAGEATLKVDVSSDQSKKVLHSHEQKVAVPDTDPRVKEGEMYSIIHVKAMGALTFNEAGWFTFTVSIDGEAKRKLKIQVIEQKIKVAAPAAAATPS